MRSARIKKSSNWMNGKRNRTFNGNFPTSIRLTGHESMHLPSRRSCHLTLSLLLWAILNKMSDLSTMETSILPFLAIHGQMTHATTITTFLLSRALLFFPPFSCCCCCCFLGQTFLFFDSSTLASFFNLYLLHASMPTSFSKVAPIGI